MGGIMKTTMKGINSTKKILSGKGNLSDVLSVATGLPTADRGTGPGLTALDFHPDEAATDQAAITGLAKSQQDATGAFNVQDQASRAAARAQLSQALTTQGQATFQQGLPATEEMLNSQHLLNSSGLGQEIARQQGNLATNIANTVGVQGASDIDRASNINLSALQGFQNQQAQAQSRVFSLQDFARNAQVAQALGSQAAPQVSGKSAGVSGGLAGAGSGATAGSAFGPWGAAIGGVLGGAAGYAGSQK